MTQQQRQRPDTDTVILHSGYAEARARTETLVGEFDRSIAARQLELPSLPEVVLKIRSALADENVSLAEITRLLGTDPALAARVLRTANSAMFYRGSRPIVDLRTAVSRLGYHMVRNVSLSFAAQQVFIGYSTRQLRDCVSGVWQHCVHTAVIAHMLARVRTRQNPDEAFLAGLLHEVGKLYILMRVKDDIERLNDEPAFRAVVAAWHPRLGQAVIDVWQLSADLAVAVGEHEQCGLEASDPSSLTQLLAVANYLAENGERACQDSQFHSKVPALGSLAMDKRTFDWLVRTADVDVRLLMLAFGI